MMLRRTFVACTLLFASGARAQQSVPSVDVGAAADSSTESPQILQARQEFRLGSALAQQGRWSDALAAFERSARLKEHPVTTYNLAYCARALGRFVRAYQEFQAALSPSAAAGGATLPEEYQVQARAYVAELNQRIAHAAVTLGSPEMTIRVDGMSVATLRTDDDTTTYFVTSEEQKAAPRLPPRFDLWLDPGNHVFIVSRARVADVTKVQSFAPGASEALAFADIRPPAAPAPPAPPENPTARSGKPDRTWAIVSLGVGAAGFVASGVFTILSLNLKSDLESRCAPNGSCPPADANDVDRAKRFADYATAGMVVGGVGAALGATLWFTAKPSHDRGGFAPWVGVGSAGVTGSF